MIIAIDFDGTLCDPNNIRTGYRMGPPEPGAILATQRLAQEGHTIIVFTARNVQDARAFKAVQDWCSYFKIPIHGITNIKKPEFDIIIDNRALRYDSWPTTLSHLHKLISDSKLA